MSSGAPFPKRYRSKFSRTKSGCLSCRSRRKKCDDLKPVCGLCSRLLVTCEWPKSETSPGSSTTSSFDDRTPRQCTERGDDRGSQPSHQHCVRIGSAHIDDEKTIARDNDSSSSALSDSGASQPAKICDKRRHPSTTSSRSSRHNDDRLPNDSRYASSSPKSLTRCDRPCMPAVVAIASPVANRVQLFNTFLSTHVPSNVSGQERKGSVYLMYFGFLEELARAPCTEPALIAAMSALSLVSVGSMIRDPEMLQKSTEKYSSAVNRLAIAIQRPDSACDDDLFATIMVLATCEFYEPFREKSQSRGYWSHIIGLHSLLEARGPRPPKSQLLSLVLAKARTSSITKSVFFHQQDFYETPGWRELKLDVPSLDQDRSCELGIRMSQLFVRNDNLDLDDARSLQEIDELLRDAADLERDLRSNLDHHILSTVTSTSLPMTLEDIECFPRFCKLVADRTLSTAHRFPSYTLAYRYNFYWMRVATLRTVVKTLQAKRCLLSTDDLPTFACGFGKPVTESELRHYVICLCRNIPFFAEPACASAGDICSFYPLHWAGKYFAECKDAKWSAWVEDVRKHLFVRGVSSPLQTPEVDSR